MSQKQKIVALSSCEAEYTAATAGTCQGVWLGRVLSNINNEKVTATMKIDNKSAIALARNPIYHERSEHIDTYYHFIRECLQNRDI